MTALTPKCRGLGCERISIATVEVSVGHIGHAGELAAFLPEGQFSDDDERIWLCADHEHDLECMGEILIKAAP